MSHNDHNSTVNRSDSNARYGARVTSNATHSASTHNGSTSTSTPALVIGSYLDEATSEERHVLFDCLQAALLSIIAQGRSIYLEGFGILFLKNTESRRNEAVGERNILCTEINRVIAFEKCADLTAYHRERFLNVAETREVCERLFAELPLAFAWDLGPEKTRALCKAIIRQIKYETVTEGICKRLHQLGDFYALHNRQGMTVTDWFAGSDIFIKSRHTQLVRRSEITAYPRPVLNNAWEPIEAGLGIPLKVFELHIPTQLAALGYTVTDDGALGNPNIPVAVFAHRYSKTGPRTFIYVTDGLRKEARSDACGCELVFQVDEESLGFGLSSLQDVPEWPAKALTLGWILLNGSRRRTIEIGSEFAADRPLCPNVSSHEIKSVFAVPFGLLRNEQLIGKGHFRYVNLVGVSEIEAAWMKKFSSVDLLNVLEYKRADQVTRQARKSFVLNAATASKRSAKVTSAPPAKTSEQRGLYTGDRQNPFPAGYATAI